jgi:hypothetical protein
VAIFRLLSALFFALSLLGTTGCAPFVSVGYAYDRRTSFSEVKSFVMAEPNEPIPTGSTALDPFVMQRLRQLTYQALKARGFLPAKSRGEADVVVHLLAAEASRTEVYSSGGSRFYGMGPYAGGPYWSTWGYPMVSSRTYREAKLVIDIVHRERNAVLWRGTGERIWESTPPDEELAALVQKILENFPPQKSDQ